MIRDLNRREFLLTTAALAAASRLPAQAPAGGAAAKGGVILFQGDSITDCGRNRESADPHAARGFKFYNRGISGNKVPDLQQRWTTDAIDLKPDVLSILIGVNDFWHKLDHGYNGTVQDYEQQYAALLQTTRDALPHVHLIVLEPFVLRAGAVDARWFPEFDQRRAAAARVAARARATFVPLQTIFNQRARTAPPEYWAADGVHPTPAGHAVIAEQWRRAANL